MDSGDPGTVRFYKDAMFWRQMHAQKNYICDSTTWHIVNSDTVIAMSVADIVYVQIGAWTWLFQCK